jgi:hypothetical protein
MEDKRKAARKKWRDTNPEKAKAEEQYQEQLHSYAIQEGIDPGELALAMEDHLSFCFFLSASNVGLGHFNDNPKLLQNAIAYLQQHGE